jgi:hypothetical protein
VYAQKVYRGFESLSLRQIYPGVRSSGDQWSPPVDSSKLMLAVPHVPVGVSSNASRFPSVIIREEADDVSGLSGGFEEGGPASLNYIG